MPTTSLCSTAANCNAKLLRSLTSHSDRNRSSREWVRCRRGRPLLSRGLSRSCRRVCRCSRRSSLEVVRSQLHLRVSTPHCRRGFGQRLLKEGSSTLRGLFGYGIAAGNAIVSAGSFVCRHHQMRLCLRTSMLHRRQQLRIDSCQPGQRSRIQPIIFSSTLPDQAHVACMPRSLRVPTRSTPGSPTANASPCAMQNSSHLLASLEKLLS